MKFEEKSILDLENLNKLGRAQELDYESNTKLVREIVSNIKRVMRKNNLISLSAPGIGYNKRIFCIDFSDKEIKSFINPVVTNVQGMQLVREQCSSIPDKEFLVPRHNTIDIIYTTPTGQIKTKRLKGVVAFVFQHEIDHLNGITLDDIGLEVDSDFDNATEEERESIIDMYLDSLDLRQKYLEEAIESDEELRLVSDRLRFVEALARGDIQFEKQEE